MREAVVEVELAGRLTRGMTVTDFRPRAGLRANALVATSLDVQGFWALLLDALARIGPG